MKKRINLLIYHKKYKETELVFSVIRKGVTVFLFFSLLIIPLMLLILNNKKTQLNQLIEERNKLKEKLNKKKEVEIAYQIFSHKFGQLKEILSFDVNFFPNYQLINDSLKNATTGAFLDSIEIDKNKKTNFIVSFQNIDELINFLNYIEEKKYLSNFSQLTLKSFTLDQSSFGSQAIKKYQLNFSGQFKKDNEN